MFKFPSDGAAVDPLDHILSDTRLEEMGAAVSPTLASPLLALLLLQRPSRLLGRELCLGLWFS